MLHKNAYVSYTYPVYQGPEENNKVVGFIGKCNTLPPNQYYFDTTGFLAASLTEYIYQKETSEIVTIPNVVVTNKGKKLDSGGTTLDYAMLDILPHIKKSAFADLTPEDVEHPVTMDLVIFNKTNYMLHSTRMYPAFDCVSKHIGYFNTVCDNYGIFVTLEQCHKHQQFQEKIVQKAVRNKLR